MTVSTTPLSPTAIADKLATDGTVVIRVKVLPNSAHSEIVGLMSDGTLKIRVNATPEKGRANDELIRYLADEFDLAKAGITLISGHIDTHKLVRLTK